MPIADALFEEFGFYFHTFTPTNNRERERERALFGFRVGELAGNIIQPLLDPPKYTTMTTNRPALLDLPQNSNNFPSYIQPK